MKASQDVLYTSLFLFSSFLARKENNIAGGELPCVPFLCAGCPLCVMTRTRCASHVALVLGIHSAHIFLPRFILHRCAIFGSLLPIPSIQSTPPLLVEKWRRSTSHRS